eukprot:TRINITY_DN50456_c0_g2_i1.p2 TRINITY_DN50456_c0_g2~~TRINITY_DN50456_c0_g2_i1.p2  ORF type:complete len:126 (-),score=5.94 TRINITY_DN50456_c0_g2_i1:118-495(-)
MREFLFANASASDCTTLKSGFGCTVRCHPGHVLLAADVRTDSRELEVVCQFGSLTPSEALCVEPEVGRGFEILSSAVDILIRAAGLLITAVQSTLVLPMGLCFVGAVVWCVTRQRFMGKWKGGNT